MIENIEKWVLYILRATLVVAFVGAIVEVNWSIVFVTAITLFLTFTPYLFQKRYKITLPLEFVLFIVLFLYATLFLGEVYNFYQLFWWWDVLLHGGSAIGFGLIGFIILYILHRAGRLQARPGLIAIFSFSFAMAIGALWEVFEFTGDQILGTSMQKNGLHDTMWDIIVDAGGAFVASLGGYFYLKGKGNFIGRAAEKFVKRNKRFLKK